MGNYAGLVINGTPLSDENSGYAVAGIGDVNGDGFDDIAVSAFRSDTNLTYNGNTTEYRNAGAVFVVFGDDAGFDTSLNLDDLDGTDGFKITPEGGLIPDGFYGDGYVVAFGSRFGVDVVGLGDVNGDNIDDFAIAQAATRRNPDAYYSEGGDQYTVFDQGVAYVIYGGTEPVSAEESAGDLAGFRIDVDGEITSLDAPGDINGDGFNDVIVNERDRDSNGTNSVDFYYLYDTNGNGTYDPDTDEFAYNGTYEFQTGTTSGFVVFGTDQERVSDTPIATPNPITFPQVALAALTTGSPAGSVIVNSNNLDGGDGFEVGTGTISTPANGNYGGPGQGYLYLGGGGGDGKLAGIGDFNGDGFDDLATNSNRYSGFQYYYYSIIRDPDGNVTFSPQEPFGGGSSTSGAVLIFGQDTDTDAYPAFVNTGLFTSADIDYRVSRLALFGEDYFGGIGDVSGDDGREDFAFFDTLFTSQTTAVTQNTRGVFVVNGTDQPPFSDNTFGSTDPKVREQVIDDILSAQGAFFYDSSETFGGIVGLSDSKAAGVGDVNSDGIDDFLIYGTTGSPVLGVDVAYLVFGDDTPFTGLVDLDALITDPTKGYKIFGSQPDLRISDAAGAGDLNGDGHDDIILGSHFDNGLDGVSFVIFGGTDALEAADNATGANDNQIDIHDLAVNVDTGVLPIFVSVQNAGRYTDSQAEGDSGATVYSFTVQRTGDPSETVSFDYAVSGFGSNGATADDFVGGAFPSGSATFAAGSAITTVNIEVQGDLNIENSEDFQFEISNAATTGTSPISIEGSQSFGRILNDDQPTNVYVYGTSRNEDSAQSVGFTVYRYGDQTSTVNGDYVITAGSADDNDISGTFPLTGSFTIPGGQFSAFIPINQTADTDIEFSESVSISISNVTSPDSLNLNVGNTTSTAYIYNDDFPPRITVSVDDSFVQEGDSGTTDVTFTIARSGDGLSGDVDVTFDVNPFPGAGDFFALNSDDVVGFLPSFGNVLTIPDGQASVDFVVQIVGDGIIEPRESMILDVTQVTSTNGTTYDIFDNRVVTVFNDDGRPPSIPAGIEADVFGDPHIVTLDGLGYDFQAVGEYILVETEAGATNPFQVQVRFEPLPGSDLVSVTTRMAVDVGGSTVEVDALGSNAILIDGVALSAAQLATGAVDVDGDAADPGGQYDLYFNEDQSEITVVLNDANEQLMIKNMDGVLNICVFLADPGTTPGGNAGAIQGLMGNGNGTLGDDYELRDGSTIPASELTTDAEGVPSLSFDYIYGRGDHEGAGYAQSWALPAGERLFTNTATYPTGFPAASLKIDDLPTELRDAAEAAALAAGLDPAEEAIFEAAVLDFALTGDADFIQGALGLAAEAAGSSEPTDVPELPTTVGVSTGEPTGELTEGDTGSTSTLFTFYRIGDATGELTVDYLVGGDVDAADFAAGTVLTGSVTFADGETSTSISLDVSGDLTTEDDEDIVVSITGTSNPAALVGASMATTTVVTDDFAPVAEDDEVGGGENSTISGNVFAANPTDQDSDADNDPLMVLEFRDSDGNTYDADGTEKTLPSGALLAVFANGDFTFKPSGDGSGTEYDQLGDGEQAQEMFVYVVEDGNGGADEGEVTITINGENDAPVAVDDEEAVDEDETLYIFPTDNDEDAEGDFLEIIDVGSASNGMAVYDEEGGIVYTPNPDFSGSDSFTYTISDGEFTSMATVSVTVNPINDDPIITTEQDQTVPENTTDVVSIVATDVDGPFQSFEISGGVDASLFSIDEFSGNLSFITPPDFELPGDQDGDNFYDVEVTVIDDAGGSDSLSLNVEVTNVVENTPPAAEDDSYDGLFEDTLVVDAANGVLANDTDDDNDDLTVTELVGPANGDLTLNPDGSFEYLPQEGFSGQDSFTYTVSDGNGGTDEGEVILNVPAPNNEEPTAEPDTFSTEFGTSLTINIADEILANDTDPENDTLSFTGFTPDGLNVGELVDNNDGTLTYTPAGGDTLDIFNYTISDGNGNTSEATIEITTGLPGERELDISILEQNEGDNGITEFVFGITRFGEPNDLLVTDTLTAVTGPVDPNFNIDDLPDATPGVDFNPVDTSVTFGPGETLKTVTVEVIGDTDIEMDEIFQLYFAWVPTPDVPNGNGSYPISNVPADVTGTIINDDANGAPNAQDDAFETSEEGLLIANVIDGTITDTDGNTTPNPNGGADSDGENDPLSIVSATDSEGNALSVDGLFNDLPEGGRLTITPTGGIVFDPDDDFNDLGVDQQRDLAINYVLSDESSTDDATVSITVTGENDEPTANEDVFTTQVGVPITFSVADILANDTDPDNDDPLTVVDVGPVEGGGGSLVDNGDGTYTYTPTPEASGDGGLAVYVIEDSQGAQSSSGIIFSIDFPGTRTVDVSLLDMNEGDDGITEYVFGMTRNSVNGESSDLNVTDTINYETVPVDPNFNFENLPDATPGVDFEAASGSVTFAPGEVFKSVTVNVFGDTDIEPDEIFQLNLSHSGFYDNFFVPEDATAIIRNDDSDEPNNPYVPENYDNVFIGDELMNPFQGTPDDDWMEGRDNRDNINGGAGNDYIIAGPGNDWYVRGGSGADIFQFGPGDGDVKIHDWEDGTDKVRLVGGLQFEDLSETSFTYNGVTTTILTTATGDRLMFNNTAPEDIDVEDFIVGDAVTPSTTVSLSDDFAVLEGNSGQATVEFMITRSSSEGTVNVQLSYGGSAEFGTDYVDGLTTDITFDDGVDSIAVQLVIQGDMDVEPDEMIEVAIDSVSGDGTPIISDGDLVLTIINDDPAGNPYDPENYDNVFIGDDGLNPFQGTPENDWIDGAGNRDNINGGAGNDYIIAGPGNDWYVRGGEGSDIFQFGIGDGDIKIHDWQDGADLIRLVDGMTYDDLTMNSVTFGGVTTTIMSNANGDRLMFHNTLPSSLTEDDFI